MAIGVATRAAPVAFGESVTEGYLTQPMAFGNARAAGGRLHALATLNLEGATLQRGEINPGGYGESYIDRRHPHTYLHEAMLGASTNGRRAGASLFVGKGVVPFGSDDPMIRPFEKYPVNHHLAQVMERALVVGALRITRAAVEVARFNGDEPEHPSDWPNAGRAMDSWAIRATAWGPYGLELSGSSARVRSPEFATGEGLDQRKSAVSLRFDRPTHRVRYALAEWARTREGNDRRRDIFSFSSLLAEGELALPKATIAVRAERTERPEEDRLDNPYRSVRPLLDFNILGRTRWSIVTLNVAPPPRRVGHVTLVPFVEAAWLQPRAVNRPSALDPVVFFGATQLWMWSSGIRLDAGSMGRRFGRYGVAAGVR